MPPSGYVQVDPAKQTKGIRRQGALHLTLPLVERHSRVYDSASSEENLLTLASSRYTISAAPKTSSSLYSQESYYLSPPAFSEARVNRRRFGLAATPVEEGPWRRPSPLGSADTNVFVLDLKSATVDANPFLGSDEEVDDSQPDDVEERVEVQEVKVEEKKVMMVYAPAETVLPVIGKPMEVVPPRVIEGEEASNAKKRLRMTSKVIGKMLSRLSAHQSTSSRPANTDEQPLLPALPPQILISLPSPGLKFPNSPTVQDQDALGMGPKDDLHAFVLEKQMHAAAGTAAGAAPGTRSTLPSTWKPRRPPSPLPKLLRKHSKQKRNASALSHHVVASPPPPLPPRARIAAVESSQAVSGYASFSSPLSSAASPLGQDASRWDDVRMRLRARALKSSGYAIHDGGIISPIASS